MDKEIEFQSQSEIIPEESVVEREPAIRVNEKALHNSYIDRHLVNKKISVEDVLNCLTNGEEITNEIKNPKIGSRYFKIEIPEITNIPGRFVLPDPDGPLGGKVANWNCSCEYKFRHGKLAPIVRRDQLPEWLINYGSALFVILEKNQLPDGRLQTPDGPTSEDPEGSWMVATAHFGPPSRLKPRLPKIINTPDVPEDLSKPELLKQYLETLTQSSSDYSKKTREYLEDLDSWNREQDRVIFVDLEIDGRTGLAEKTNIPSDENHELKKLISYQTESIGELRKQMEALRKQIQKK